MPLGRSTFGCVFASFEKEAPQFSHRICFQLRSKTSREAPLTRRPSADASTGCVDVTCDVRTCRSSFRVVGEPVCFVRLVPLEALSDTVPFQTKISRKIGASWVIRYIRLSLRRMTYDAGL